MRNYTSDTKFREKYNKEQNALLSRRLKNIKAAVSTKSPDTFYQIKTANNSRSHKVKGNISKLYNNNKILLYSATI